VGAGGELVESELAALVAIVGCAACWPGRARGSTMGACKAKARVCARAFWTIAVIDGCYEGVSPVAASASRKRRSAGRGGRGDGTAVHLPAMRQADVHL
jgi:hypothetical protein